MLADDVVEEKVALVLALADKPVHEDCREGDGAEDVKSKDLDLSVPLGTCFGRWV